MKIHTALLISLVLSLLIPGCKDPEAGGDVVKGGAARLALYSARGDLFPLNITEFSMRQISENLLNPSFIKYNAEGEAQPELAHSWDIDMQARTITFKLRNNIRWSNGRKLSTFDVKFTHDLLKSHGETYRLKAKITPIESLEIVDSLTCRFKFTRPVADPLNQTKIPLLPMEWQEYLSDPKQIEARFLSDFIGCGPFIIKNCNNDSLNCVRNRFYSDEKPYIDSILFYFNPKTLEDMAVLTKKVDMIINVPIDAVKLIRRDTLFHIDTYPERGYSFIAWNLRNNLFKNKELRRALTIGIDRETIVDGVLSGFGTKIDGPWYPEVFREQNKIKELEYNAIMAQTLLDTLGWLENKEGLRVKNERRLRFDLLINRENKIREQIALNIQKNLVALGVEVNIIKLPWEQILDSIYNKKFDALLLTWIDSDKYNPSELFHTAGIDKGLNLMSYSNPNADDLIEKALNSVDYRDRLNYWIQFQNIVAEDLPCTFLFSQDVIVAMNKRMHNVRMDQRGYLVGIKDWWISDR